MAHGFLLDSAGREADLDNFLPISFPTFSKGDEVFLLDHHRLKMFTLLV